ncbi:MAG: hypothetical protein QXZ13_02505 [Candidatus Diapherotrites archaeon]
MNSMELRAYANASLVFIFVLAFNLMANSLSFIVNLANSLIFTSILLIAITLFLGPISRLFPKKFRHDLLYRKPIGISGVLFAFAYFAILLIGIYKLDFQKMVEPINYYANIYLILGLLVLIGLVIISRPKSISEISFTRWKTLQGWGYVALIFLLLHFAFKDGFYHLSTYSGKTLILFGFLCLGAKLATIIFSLHKKHTDFEISTLKGHHEKHKKTK